MTDAQRFVSRLVVEVDLMVEDADASLVQHSGIVTIKFPDGTRVDFTVPLAHDS